jgi:plastocyanin domain-containing protein
MRTRRPVPTTAAPIAGVAWTLVTLAFIALALAGCASKPTTASNEFAIEVTDEGFVPPVVYLPKGKPVTLTVTRKTDATCATAMVFAKTGQKYELPLNQTVRIELPANDADTLNYACGMNMIKGQLVVR